MPTKIVVGVRPLKWNIQVKWILLLDPSLSNQPDHEVDAALNFMCGSACVRECMCLTSTYALGQTKEHNSPHLNTQDLGTPLHPAPFMAIVTTKWFRRCTQYGHHCTPWTEWCTGTCITLQHIQVMASLCYSHFRVLKCPDKREMLLDDHFTNLEEKDSVIMVHLHLPPLLHGRRLLAQKVTRDLHVNTARDMETVITMPSPRYPTSTWLPP